MNRIDGTVDRYEDLTISISLPGSEMPVQLTFSSLNPSLNLLGYVGEELWDAAYLLSAFIISSVQNDDCSLKGRKILELGSGCGLVGMVAALLGPSQVILSDYTETVLQNLHSNVSTNKTAILGSNPNALIHCTCLDWSSYLRPDICNVEWIHEQSTRSQTPVSMMQISKDGCNEVTVDLSNIDLIIGSALVYSLDGAFMCADTIHYFFEHSSLRKTWILQITARPGFDRFMLRLLSFGYSLELCCISDDVVTVASKIARRKIGSKDDFKLLEIKRMDLCSP